MGNTASPTRIHTALVGRDTLFLFQEFGVITPYDLQSKTFCPSQTLGDSALDLRQAIALDGGFLVEMNAEGVQEIHLGIVDSL